MSILRRLSGFSPFQDMTDVSEVYMSKTIHDRLVERLNWGLKNGLEDGGLITVSKKPKVNVVDFYDAPDEFKSLEHFNTPKMLSSEWFERTKRNLISKGEKIGFEYHTHAILVNHDIQVEHEEGKAEYRLNSYDEQNPLRNKLGDMIIEKENNGQVYFFGFTPSERPHMINLDGHSSVKRLHHLEIIVPDMNLKYQTSFDSV